MAKIFCEIDIQRFFTQFVNMWLFPKYYSCFSGKYLVITTIQD